MATQRKPKITVPATLSTAATEASRATWWRQHRMQMTREELSQTIRYSPDTIWSFETGLRHSKRPWERYRNACAAAHRHRFPKEDGTYMFNWGLPL